MMSDELSKKLSIIQVLQKIQAEVNAPKENTGRFGKSRSAEDIIAAAKPVLAHYEAALTLNDEIIQVGERNYVKATATLYYAEEQITAVSNAWEGEVNRGLDASQITGSASSYARKYAMGGLLAIDDTKDADTHKEPIKLEPKTKVDELAKAKDNLNKLLEEYGHTNAPAKKVVINKVLEKSTVETEKEADEVSQALEDGLV